MVRRWWLMLLAMAFTMAAATTTVLTAAVNVATGGTANWFPPVERHPLWWIVGATAAGAVAPFLVWWAQRAYEQALSVLVPAVQRPEPWVVDRPGEVNQIVAALRRRRGRTVSITTAVHGAGGFGKTTVAKMVRADRRVLRRFRGRVYWVTLGRDLSKQALTGLVNGLIAQVEPGRAVTFTDARQAAEHLAAVLAAGGRRLIVLDDVWSQEHLAMFPAGGRCARLVTTRNPSLTKGAVVPVRVDQMSETQARALLLAGLPLLPPVVAGGLLEETGRWPLLLRLVNKILADQARLQSDITKDAGDLLGRLRRDGALQVDQLSGAAGQQLDITDPDERQKAVRATIQASTSLLSQAEFGRFAELAVFAEDETIPVTLITALWQATGEPDGMRDQMAMRALCTRLADLALLTLIPARDGGAVTIHDVIRDFLREELGSTRLTKLHQMLLDALAAVLPSAPAGLPDRGTVTAWWELPGQTRYLGDHLIEHMLAAGQANQAGELAADLRWVGARLHVSGPAGPDTDLALIGTSRAQRLRQVFAQAAHLLAPTDPPHSLIDILHSRVSHDPVWGAQAQILTASCSLPALINQWPLPDLPNPALLRILTGHSRSVTAVAIAPDRTWLASASEDRSVRIWDTATGQHHATLVGHNDKVTAVAIAPDGTWLASASEDRSVRIWDTATWQQRATLVGHNDKVTAVAIAPDGTWLASASADGSVRIWDAATWQQRATLTSYSGPVTALAIAPDGTWLASGGFDGPVRTWDTATRQQHATLTGHTGPVTAVRSQRTRTEPPLCIFAVLGFFWPVPAQIRLFGRTRGWGASADRRLVTGLLGARWQRAVDGLCCWAALVGLRGGGRQRVPLEGFLDALGGGAPMRWWMASACCRYSAA